MKAKTYLNTKIGRKNLKKVIDGIHNILSCAVKSKKFMELNVIFVSDINDRGFSISFEQSDELLSVNNNHLLFFGDNFKQQIYKRIKNASN